MSILCSLVSGFAHRCSAVPAIAATIIAPALLTVGGLTAQQPGGVSQRTLAEHPDLEIGGETSGPTSDLFQIRGVVMLESGRLVIADGASRLIIFDGDGTYLRTVGRRGGGPGEFGQIRAIHRMPGDSILVVEVSGWGRFSVFTGTGEFARLITPETPREILGVFADGSFLGQYIEPAPLTTAPVAFATRSVQLARLDGDLRQIESFGTFPGGGFIRISPGGIISTPFLRQTTGAVHGMTAYIATGEPEVRVLRAGGGSAPEIRSPFRTRPFPAAELSRAFAGSRFEREITDRTISGWPRDQTYPATSTVLVDAEGNLWIHEFQLDRDAVSRWSIHNSAGEPIALIELPPRLWPYYVGSDFVVGVQRDALDVPRVHRLRLQKGDSR
jgi:hypothetical protein